MKKSVLYTIGHSTRTSEQFLALLRAHGIKTLVDVRTIPKSAYNPQFNDDMLRDTLASEGIRYIHLKALGGLRHAKKNSINMGWKNASFRRYADYMQTASFARGLNRLKTISREQPTAIMCAEAVPWRCHRSLIADALTKQHWQVFHIASQKTAPLHVVTPFLRLYKGRIWYPKD